MPVTGNICPDCEEDDTLGHKMIFFGTATAAQLAALGMKGVVGPIAAQIHTAITTDGYNAGASPPYVRYPPVVDPVTGDVRIEALFTPAEPLCDTVRVEPIGPFTIP